MRSIESEKIQHILLTLGEGGGGFSFKRYSAKWSSCLIHSKVKFDRIESYILFESKLSGTATVKARQHSWSQQREWLTTTTDLVKQSFISNPLCDNSSLNDCVRYRSKFCNNLSDLSLAIVGFINVLKHFFLLCHILDIF